jgi:ribonucleoside-diphosphate reductase alpha chain
MSLKALSDYTIYSRYAHYIPEKKRRETWEEITNRVFEMHERKYKSALDSSSELKEDFEFAKEMVKKKRVLGSQRALQFGGKWVEEHNSKLYNCTFSHIDRPRVFQEIMYLLLCGCGVGFSVQKKHIALLPKVYKLTKGVKTFVIQDSIEGWADATGVLINSFFAKEDSEWPEFAGYDIQFDFSLIRPEGSLIAGQFKAPGPKGLENSLNKIKALIQERVSTGNEILRPIDYYDAIMHFSDAVLSGGVRRSATICLFSFDDEEMMNAKTGDWFIKNPQRGRSNNSVVLIRKKTSFEEFQIIMKSTKDFGEPGFYFSENEEHGVNPCVEIGLLPKTEDGRSGFQYCNLCEINGRWCDSEEKFLQACRAATIIGTMQAGYTDFTYLTKETKEICDREALLGVSITGIMDNPEILLNPEIQRKAAEECKIVNKKIAKLIGINPAARINCVKPAGSTSCVLKTSSGIHPHHARKYIRRVQANKNEFAAKHFKELNSVAVEESVWSANKTDDVISFMCEVPQGAILKNDIGAVELLEKVKLTQQNWVKSGTSKELCVDPTISHNVSNTITVKPNEWEDVTKFIYDNREYFTGISLLSGFGDLDYAQAPFSTVLNPEEIVKEYGDGAVLGSGLAVDGLSAFDNNLWVACDTALGFGEQLTEVDEPQEPIKPRRNGFKTEKAFSSALINYSIELNLYFQDISKYKQNVAKLDWIRRFKQFSERYFEKDARKTSYCLKHLCIWHRWLELKRSYKEIDWAEVVEDQQEYVDADTLGAQACVGGKCSI